MAHPLVISTSLREGSLSRAMSHRLLLDYVALGVEPVEADLRRMPLPLCDGSDAYSDPNVDKFAKLIETASPIIVATPVYNYDVNAALKNLIELTGSAWEGKIVGFICAAGGASSYMSIMAMANSLMLDFRCLIIPRFIYGVSADFGANLTPGEELARRIQQLAVESLKIRRD
ncbi:flavoprotein [Verrucomicrobia bacterium SCGC AG-212-E04]|nr:flavoprotein [Verrucomicrobia bacterium SCGC AG-212-E04]